MVEENLSSEGSPKEKKLIHYTAIAVNILHCHKPGRRVRNWLYSYLKVSA
jgi:hypothetical protein